MLPRPLALADLTSRSRCASESIQVLADGLSCLFTRAMSGLSRVCCDLADAGAGAGIGAAVESSPPDEVAAAAPSSVRASQAFTRDGGSLTIVRHPSAVAGSAVLTDACCDAVAVIAGLRRCVSVALLA